MQSRPTISTLLAHALAGVLVAGTLAACGGGGGDSGISDLPHDDEDPIPAECNLDVSKRVQSGGASSGPITYHLEVTNDGTGECEGPIRVSDILPPGIDFDSSPSSEWDCSSNSTNPQQIDCDYQEGALEDSSTLVLEGQMTDAACMASNCATLLQEERAQARACARTDCGGEDGCVEPPDGMVGWWTGDRTAEDRSGEDNDGTLENNAYYETGQVREAFGLAGQFDGVRVPDDPSLDFAGEDQFSIDAWVYPEEADSEVRMIVDKRMRASGSGNIGYALQLRGDQLIVRTQNGSSAVTHTASSPVPYQEWTHITVTVDLATDQGRVYLDGNPDSTFTPSSTGAGGLENDSPLFIGRHFDDDEGQHFAGRIDEVEIFSRVLDEDEVAQLVEAGPCGKCRADCFEGEEAESAGDDDSDDPSAETSTYLDENFGNLKGFDDDTINRNFAHTFDDLKSEEDQQHICGATLEVRMQPSVGQTYNDAINLSVSDGTSVEGRWHNHIGAGSGWTHSLRSDTWDGSNYSSWEDFTFDLGNLGPTGFSGATSSQDLIGELDDHAMLNVRVQDDTEVDSLVLTLEYCCDPDTGGGSGGGEADVVGEKRLDGELVVGDTSTYAISVTNQGNADASAPTEVRDQIPECMEIEGIQSPWDQWCSVNGQSVECTYNDPIAAGTSTSDLLVDVTPTEKCEGEVENCAEIIHDDDVHETCVGSEVSTGTGERGADLAIEKNAIDGPFGWGQTAEYELTVTNNGPLDAQGPVTVTDDLDSCLTFAGTSSANWSCSASGQQVTCERNNSLAAGASESFTIEVETTDACGDAVDNCARVEAPAPADPNMGNNESCTTTEFARVESDLLIEKAPADELNFGEVNTYDVLVENMGPSTDHGPITVTDDLPSCMEFDSASPSDWSCSTSGSPPNETVTCTHPGPLAASSVEELELDLQHISGDPDLSCGDRVENCASVDSSNPDPVTDNNESCDTSGLR